MPLQSSGPISFSEIQTEFGGGNPISMTEYYGLSTLPTSGTISASDFYGTAAYNGPSSPVTLTSSATLTSGVDFPADTVLTICMVGAGGSGGATRNYGKNGGGLSGTVVSTTTTTPAYGTAVGVTIGAGGAARFGNTTRAGLAGGSSIFNGVTAAGGAGGSALPGDGASGSINYAGNSQGNTTCGGSGTAGPLQSSHPHVTGYGGQSSGFSNGGFGRVNLSAGNAGTGGVGSGGGGVADGLDIRSSGAGGRGEIRISWVA
jgi:hypothetical protein